MSGIVVICQYIRLLTRQGVYQTNHNYQNLYIGHAKLYDGIYHKYAPYKITGNGSIRGGDGIRATLTTVPNKVTIPLTTDIVLSRLLIEVKQVFVAVATPADPLIGPQVSDFTDVRLINRQIWSCGGCSRDRDRISIVLASPLDALENHAPMRVYNSKIIGRAPATGFITSR